MAYKALTRKNPYTKTCIYIYIYIYIVVALTLGSQVVESMVAEGHRISVWIVTDSPWVFNAFDNHWFPPATMSMVLKTTVVIVTIVANRSRSQSRPG